jgi:tripartite-type tricarboxylate transporter receptor subunit TctC
MHITFDSGCSTAGSLLRTIVRIGAAFALSASLVHAAGKTMELVIPLAPGGAMDATGRAVADELSRRINEPVVVLNKPGAGTMIGTRFVAEQGSTDGRTLLLGAMAMTTTEFQAGAPFNIADLAPVAYVGWQVTVLYVRATLPVNTMAEFIQWAKASSNGVNFGSSGNGSTPHLAAEQVAARTGIKITHVPFAGSSAFIPALVGGHIDAVFDAPSTRSLVKAGKLKALMVGSSKPIADWPELATADAAGLPGFRSGGWYGVFVPARTPIDVQQKLNTEINAVLNVAAVRDKFATLGVEPAGGSPADFNHLINTERDRLRQLVKSRNLVFN